MSLYLDTSKWIFRAVERRLVVDIDGVRYFHPNVQATQGAADSMLQVYLGMQARGERARHPRGEWLEDICQGCGVPVEPHESLCTRCCEQYDRSSDSVRFGGSW